MLDTDTKLQLSLMVVVMGSRLFMTCFLIDFIFLDQYQVVKHLRVPNLHGALMIALIGGKRERSTRIYVRYVHRKIKQRETAK